MLRVKRSKKGLSGAVTALILVIASVIIALVVVGFAFGLFGTLGGTPTVNQVGTGILKLDTGEATFSLHSTGKVQIVGATIVGTTYSTATTIELTGGINPVTINFGTLNDLQPGTTYTISVALSSGQTVSVAVLAQ